MTLRNLNFNLSMPYGDDNGDDNSIDNNSEKILRVIAIDPKITQKVLADKTGLSARTVSREMKALRDLGIIKRIGSDRKGHWEIVEK